MRKSTVVAAALCVGAVIAPTAGFASPSPAPVRTSTDSALTVGLFRDSDEPRIGSTDIRRVVVDNGNRLVRVRVKEAGFRHLETRLWIDSVKSDPGPEYLISGYQNSEFFASRVEGFGDPTKPTWRCDRLRMIDDGTSRWVTFRFKSECLRGPGSIRVHADSRGNGDRDHAPNNSQSGDKRFYAWVSRGMAASTSSDPRSCDQAY